MIEKSKEGWHRIKRMEILMLRVLFGISCYSVEKALHFSDGSIKRLGKSPTSGDRILKYAHYFGVSKDFLMGNTDNPKSHLNCEAIGTLLNEVKGVTRDWRAYVSEGSLELDKKIDTILNQYGVQSDSGIEVDPDAIMNDPDLPRVQQCEEIVIENEAVTE